MRALLSTIGSRGDVQPLLALALQLRALGQDVRLCAPPDFRVWIEGLGIPFTPLGLEVRQAAVSRPAVPPTPTAEQLRATIDATVSTQFATITDAAHDCDVIVAATALQVAARSVAEKIGIGYVFAAYCPIVFPSPHHAPPPLPPAPGEVPASATATNEELWARSAQRSNATFGPSLNAHRTSLGLDPVTDVRGHMFTDRPWLAADPVLAPWPDLENDAVFQPGAWILPDDRPLPSELETFLDAGEPPLYFGFSSMRAPQDVSRVIVESTRALGRRAVVSRGWADLSVVDNAADCITIGEVNLQALFSRVAAVVHHGGAGTTTLAALAGAPHVVVPQIYDQHYFAQRVHTLGIGSAHAPGTPTTDSLTRALEHALQRDMAARARSVAQKMRRDGAEAAARRLINDHGSG